MGITHSRYNIIGSAVVGGTRKEMYRYVRSSNELLYTKVPELDPSLEIN